jgi:hypothetical protein
MLQKYALLNVYAPLAVRNMTENVCYFIALHQLVMVLIVTVKD